MTTQMKRRLDGSVVPYDAMPILESPEFVKSLPHARESFDQPHAYCGRDSLGRLWLNGKKHAPTRDELIEGALYYRVQEVFRDPVTHRVMYGPLRHWTRAEAESKVDRLYPDLAAHPTEKTR